MFDFLNKLTHNHTPPPVPEVQFEDLSSENQNPPQTIERYQEQSKSSRSNSREVIKPAKKIIEPIKKVKKVQSRISKMQYVTKIQLQPHIKNIFEGLLKDSKKGSSQVVRNQVDSLIKQKQRNVYIRQMSKSESQYLSQFSHFVQFQNNYVKEQIGVTINSIIDQISGQIEQDQYTIKMQGLKYQSSDNHKLETMKLIKQHQNELESKIGQLSIDLNVGESIVDRRAKEILDKDSFHPDSYKTKMAGEFVRQKQREREEIKSKMEEFKQRKRSIEFKAKEQQLQKLELLKQERHQKLKIQFLEKKRSRSQRQSKSKVDEKDYKQFLKQYKQSKPLYQLKEEEYNQRLKQQKKEKYILLRQKQKLFASIDLQTIEMHADRYEQLKEEDRLRKQAEIDLAKRQNHLRKKELDEKAYKGKFRYLILKEMVEEQNKKKQKQQQKQRILMRKQAYSLQVKQRFKPQIDYTKRKQVQQIINSHRNTKRKYLTPNRVAFSQRYSTINQNQDVYSQPQIDAKRQGQKYHRQFKQYIRNKIQRGQIKDEERSMVSETVTPKQDYLKELRQKYERMIPSQSSRLDRQIANLQEGDDCSIMIMKAQEYERKAKQREVKLRNMAHRPQEQAKLQEQYLCAIKAKMSLIQKMD